MAVLFNQKVSRGVVDDFSCETSDSNYSTTLAANTAQSLTVPITAPLGMGASVSNTNAFIAIIIPGYGKNVYMAKNATAVVAPASFTSTNSKLIPPNGIARHVKAGDTLSFITADTTAIVNVEFYFYNA